MELRCRMNAEAGVFSIILQPGVMLDFQKLGITERMPGLLPVGWRYGKSSVFWIIMFPAAAR